MRYPPTIFEEVSSADFESRNYCSKVAVRINHHITDADEAGETTLIFEYPGSMIMISVTDDDLGRISELIGGFRAGIKQLEGL